MATTYTISFDSDVPLTAIQVDVSGAERAVLNEDHFAESGSGPYTYTGKYVAETPGDYDFTLVGAVSDSGQQALDGATGSMSVSGDAATQTTLNSNGVWSWHVNPTAIRNGTKTFFGSATNTGDSQINSYDHLDGSVTTTTLRTFSEDDHIIPSSIIRPDGKVQTFYAGHGSSNVWTKVSSNSNDVSSFGSETAIGNVNNNNVYPNAAPLWDENEVYVWWRGDNDTAVVRSTDGGQTWENHKIAFTYSNGRLYTQAYWTPDGSIHLATERANGGGTDPKYDVFYARYKDGNFYNADGSLLFTWSDLPVSITQLEKVRDTEALGHYARFYDMAFDRNNRPVLGYAETTGSNWDTHTHRVARWNGSQWLDSEVAQVGNTIADGSFNNEQSFSGGVAIDRKNPNIVYVADSPTNTDGDIKMFRSPDNGRSWNQVRALTSDSTMNARPVCPDNAHRDMQVMWWEGTYNVYYDYDTSVEGYTVPVSGGGGGDGTTEGWAYWDFEGDATDQWGGRDITSTNAITYSGGAAQFDGSSSWMEYPEEPFSDKTSARTILLDFTPQDVSTRQHFAEYRNFGAIDYNNSQVGFRTQTSSGTTADYLSLVSGGSAGTRYTAAIAYDGSTLEAAVNGSLVDSMSASQVGDFSNQFSTSSFGRDWNKADRHAEMNLHEAKVWQEYKDPTTIT